MTISKAQQRAVNKYISKAYDRLNVTIPKGRKQTIEAYAKSRGESVNALIGRLLRAELGMSDDEWRQAPESNMPPEL